MRKSHRKSRNGCSQCKQRHIKCNELRPQCGNCQRLEIACSFTPLTPLPDATMSPAESIIGTPLLPTLAYTQPLSILDLELYHHFIYDYSASLFTSKALRDSILENILQLALDKHYLLHSLLALSALHLFHKDRSRIELFERACYLQGVAIQQVQLIIPTLSQDHAISALLFSGHTAAFGLAEYMLNPHHSSDLTDPIDKMIECFQLSRGVKIVVSPYFEYLKDSWLKPLFGVEHLKEENKENLGSKFPTYQLVRSLAFGQEDPERRQLCLRLTDEVFFYMDTITTQRDKIPTSTHLIDSWAVQLDLAFKDMLTERRPAALIILAHYAVLMSMEPRAWHLRGWPRILIQRIDGILGPEWSEFLRWPKDRIMGEEVNFELPTFGNHSNNPSQSATPSFGELLDSHHEEQHISESPSYSNYPSPFGYDTTPII